MSVMEIEDYTLGTVLTDENRNQLIIRERLNELPRLEKLKNFLTGNEDTGYDNIVVCSRGLHGNNLKEEDMMVIEAKDKLKVPVGFIEYLEGMSEEFWSAVETDEEVGILDLGAMESPLKGVCEQANKDAQNQSKP